MAEWSGVGIRKNVAEIDRGAVGTCICLRYDAGVSWILPSRTAPAAGTNIEVLLSSYVRVEERKSENELQAA